MGIDKIRDLFNTAALKYDEQRKLFIPCFDDYYQTGASFISEIRGDFRSVLDLGAGTGLLTKYLVEKFPDATYTLVDASEQMIEIARTRFEGKRNFNYLISDYSGGLPSGIHDLIASALSIHHLEDKAKMSLYKDIFNNLADGGFFLNLDQFNASSEFMNDHFNSYWYNTIIHSGIVEKERELWLQRRELDRENTIAESIAMLKQAGFRSVDCIYNYMKFGVILAIKQNVLPRG